MAKCGRDQFKERKRVSMLLQSHLISRIKRLKKFAISKLKLRRGCFMILLEKILVIADSLISKSFLSFKKPREKISLPSLPSNLAHRQLSRLNKDSTIQVALASKELLIKTSQLLLRGCFRPMNFSKIRESFQQPQQVPVVKSHL